MPVATNFPINIPTGYNITNAFLAVFQDQNGNPAVIPINPSGTAIIAQILPSNGDFTDRSGTVTVGGTAQQLAPANTSRKYLFIQNNSSGDLWINFGANATTAQPSVKVEAGANFFWESSFVPSSSISVIGATTGQTFTAKEA